MEVKDLIIQTAIFAASSDLDADNITTAPSDLKVLTLVNHHFRERVQPFLFRNINLRAVQDAFQFFEIILRSRIHLGHGVRILQFSLDLDSLCEGADNLSGLSKNSIDHFWDLWAQCRPEMVNVHTLIVGYACGDDNFLRRFVRKGAPQEMLNLQRLHFSPVFDQWVREVRLPSIDVFDLTAFSLLKKGEPPDGPDSGPWDRQHWAQYLCHSKLARIPFLILSTPLNPFWPPTVQQIQTLRRSWFGSLAPTSQLSTFVLRYGYAEYAMRLKDWLDENPPEHASPGSPDGYPVGGWQPPLDDFEIPALVWRRKEAAGSSIDWEDVNLQQEWGVEECGWEEHLCFDIVRGTAATASRVYGYESHLYSVLHV
ncbi:hypothetical protein B0H13DRAFT_2371992 [Mycena leptocephala]|nr:hypothetical protein B0H13DRAFT_2371992 [Mycena leptocephala]